MIAKRPAFRSLVLALLAMIGVGHDADGVPASTSSKSASNAATDRNTSTASIPERLRAVRAHLAKQAITTMHARDSAIGRTGNGETSNRDTNNPGTLAQWYNWSNVFNNFRNAKP